MIGRIVGWSLRSRGVVLGAAEVEPLITVPAQPRHRPAPLAVVVLGGLVTTTLLNLVVIPALYLRFGPSSEQRIDAAQ